MSGTNVVLFEKHGYSNHKLPIFLIFSEEIALGDEFIQSRRDNFPLKTANIRQNRKIYRRRQQYFIITLWLLNTVQVPPLKLWSVSLLTTLLQTLIRRLFNEPIHPYRWTLDVLLQYSQSAAVASHPPSQIRLAILYDSYLEEEGEWMSLGNVQFLKYLLVLIEDQKPSPPTYRSSYQSLGTIKLSPSSIEFRSSTMLIGFLYSIDPLILIYYSTADVWQNQANVRRLFDDSPPWFENQTLILWLFTYLTYWLHN